MKKKAIISIFATVFFVLTLTLFSYATTKTQDGLQVELTTDKSSYTSSDTISVTVKVTNTGTTAVSDLTLENTIPTGYTKTTNTSSTKSVSILLAGDEATLTTSFVKDGSGTSSAGNTSGDSGGTSSGSSNASSGSSGTGGNSNSSSSGSGSGSGNSSSGERGTTNTTDGVTATSGSDLLQSSYRNGAEDLTIGEGTTSATSGDDTTGGEISGMSGGSSASDVGDDSTDGALSNEGESAEGESSVISQNENAYDDGTVAGAEGSDIDGDTGDSSVSPVAIAVGVIVVVAIAVAIVKIKSGKKLLSILLCVSVLSAFEGEMLSFASEYKSIHLTCDASVDGSVIQISTVVKYFRETDRVPLEPPVEIHENEKIYWENFKVYQITDVNESSKTHSEKDVLSELEARGFGNRDVIYNYTMDGQYLDDASSKRDSSQMHPEYTFDYYSRVGEIWMVHVVNGSIWAQPLTYNFSLSENETGIYISESNMIEEYVSRTNQYYSIIPNSTWANIKTVDRITAETLDALTAKELSKK